MSHLGSLDVIRIGTNVCSAHRLTASRGCTGRKAFVPMMLTMKAVRTRHFREDARQNRILDVI